MTTSREGAARLDWVVLLVLLAIFILVSPLRLWWGADDNPWYLPYLLWAGILVLAMIVQWRRSRHGF
jgi:hypothetical protein